MGGHFQVECEGAPEPPTLMLTIALTLDDKVGEFKSFPPKSPP